MRRLVLVGAEKIGLRTQSADTPNSIWAISLLDEQTSLVQTHKGYVKSIKQVVDKKGRVRTGRKACYPMHGGTSVVKEVIWIQTGAAAGQSGQSLPSIVIKLLNNRTYSSNGQAKSVAMMPVAARLMRIQGMQAVAGERVKPAASSSWRAGQTCHYLAMERFEVDLHGAVQLKDPAKIPDVSSDAGAKSFLLSTIRTLAFLQFFYNTFGRIVQDIKLENIVPIMNANRHITALNIFDLDGSLAGGGVRTAAFMNRSDDEMIENLPDTRAIPVAVDFHTLANTLSIAVWHCQKGSSPHNVDYRLKTSRSGEEYYVINHPRHKRHNTPLTNLLKIMRLCPSTTSDASQIVKYFCKNESPALAAEVMPVYEEALAGFQTRYQQDLTQQPMLALNGGGVAAPTSALSSSSSSSAAAAAAAIAAPSSKPIDRAVIEAWQRLTRRFWVYEYASLSVLQKRYAGPLEKPQMQQIRLFTLGVDAVDEDYKLVTSAVGLATLQQWKADSQTQTYTDQEVIKCWNFARQTLGLQADADLDMVSECIQTAVENMGIFELDEFSKSRVVDSKLKMARAVLHTPASWDAIKAYKATQDAAAAAAPRI